MKTALEEFRRLSAVPRRSFHNEKIIAYAVARAKELGLFCFYDEKNGNVLIRRDAFPGKEGRPGIVLQGHLDMVEQTDPGVEHDWENEGLVLIEDGDCITADGTTLGADNGAAAAIAFSILSDEELKNPPLEVLLTTDEEVGMLSVKDADLSWLQGDYLFNMDNGTEGKFVIGCSGGLELCIWVPAQKEKADGASYGLKITGLTGGHSGIEIGMERANALKVLGEVLHEIGKAYDFRIAQICAEGKHNAIAKEAQCSLVIEQEHSASLLAEIVRKTADRLRRIYRITDKEISIELEPLENAEPRALKEEFSKALAFLLYQLPFGVMNREQIPDSGIETSCNIGLIKKEKERIGIVMSVRSSVEERRDSLRDHIISLAQCAGCTVEEEGAAYPAWLPDWDSPLIGIFSDMYKKMYERDPIVGAVHAGLECGYIMKNSNLKAAISLGPEISGEHTTKETLSVSSLQRTRELVKAVIESI